MNSGGPIESPGLHRGLGRFDVVALCINSVVGAGGPQVYAERTFGPLTGFTVGWIFSVSRLASTALIAQVMLDYAAVLLPALAATCRSASWAGSGSPACSTSC